MKRALSVTVVVVVVLVAAFAGVALAWGPGMGRGMGYGMMGGGTCPGLAADTDPAPDAAVTEEKARELATAYAGKHFPGYKVERVLPFTGRFATATMYQVELEGPKGETRVLHINRWGNVMPFGPRWRG